MSTFIQQRREAEAATKKKHEQTYRRLAKKLSDDAKLSTAEERTMGEALDALMVPLDRLESDIDILRRAAALATDAGDLDPARQNQIACDNARDAFEQQWQQAEASAKQQRNVLHDAQRQANGRLRDAETAKRQHDELISQHWQLLGERDPAETARLRHVRMCLFERSMPPDAQPTVPVIEYESLFATNCAGNAGRLQRQDVLPMNDQSDQQVDEMVSVIQRRQVEQATGTGKPRAVYLGKQTDLVNVERFKDCVVCIDSRLPVDLSVDWEEGIDYLPLPGQSREQADEHREAWLKVVKKAKKDQSTEHHMRENYGQSKVIDTTHTGAKLVEQHVSREVEVVRSK
jgi:hypothetical protein